MRKLMYVLALTAVLSESRAASTPVVADDSAVSGALRLRNRAELISVTVITKEDILDCTGCDLTDILEHAGFQVRRYHPRFYSSSDTDRSYAFARGMSDTQILLLVDGVQKEDSRLSQAL